MTLTDIESAPLNSVKNRLKIQREKRMNKKNIPILLLLLLVVAPLALAEEGELYKALFRGEAEYCTLKVNHQGTGLQVGCGLTSSAPAILRIHSGLPGEVGPELWRVDAETAMAGATWRASAEVVYRLKRGGLYAVLEHDGVGHELRAPFAVPGQRRQSFTPLEAGSECRDDERTLCLGKGRYLIQAAGVAEDGTPVHGQVVAREDARGSISLTPGSQPALSIRVFGDCGTNGFRGVEIVPRKAVGFHVVVRDTANGLVREFEGSGDRMEAIRDEAALACP